jgi:hypothetical protein
MRATRQGLLDFCNQPSFIRNMYLNLDCRIERDNVFEAIAGQLSKTAFPVNSPLASVHLLSLEGLFSILSTLVAGCAAEFAPLARATCCRGPAHHVLQRHCCKVARPDCTSCHGLAAHCLPRRAARCTSVSAWDGTLEFQDPASFVDVWDALVRGEPPPIQVIPRTTGPPPASDANARVADDARAEKYIKGRLQVAADHFNRDYKKGFQFLQARIPARGTCLPLWCNVSGCPTRHLLALPTCLLRLTHLPVQAKAK